MLYVKTVTHHLQKYLIANYCVLYVSCSEVSNNKNNDPDFEFEDCILSDKCGENVQKMWQLKSVKQYKVLFCLCL